MEEFQVQSKKRTPSPQQQAVYDWALHGKGNAIIQAVAGAGKTTTLVELCSRVKQRYGRVFIGFAAYNNKIAEELKERIPFEVATVKTFHAFGYAAWRKASPGVRLEEKKIWNLLNRKDQQDKYIIPQQFHGFIKKAVSLAKNQGIGFLCPLSNTEAWMEMVDHYDLDQELSEDGEDVPDGAVESAVIYSQEILKESNEQSYTVIDFDDMVYIPLLKHCKFFRFDWFLVDECQDLNPIRLAMAKALLKPGGRLIAVGDECQPTGTMIHMGDKSLKPIEELELGDLVSGYCPQDSAVYRNRVIKGITRRHYSGDLIKVKWEDGESRYTPNHICWADFKPLNGKYIVYLMRRGFQYRIGSCRLDYKSAGAGIVHRLRTENADAAYILKYFDTKREARILELSLAYSRGIPDMTFVPVNHGGPEAQILNQEGLDQIWNSIGDNHDKASRLLEEYGLNWMYPMVEPGAHLLQSFKRPRRVYACNLVDGVEMLRMDYADCHKKTRVPITITREPYTGDVWSLSVSHDEFYTADGLVTHNCQAIYGFCGADSQSMSNIKHQFNCTELPLTVTYRCPKAVVRIAQRWASHIEAHESAPEGTFRTIQLDDFHKESINHRHAMLCRNTAPLVERAYKLIAAGVPCHVEGKEIGKGLIQLAARWKRVKTLQILAEKLLQYKDEQVTKLLAKGKESAAESLNDRVETLVVIINSLPSKATRIDLERHIENLFQNDAPTFTLSTIHKAKGREWHTVYWLGRNRYQPSGYARQDWQLDQEYNLMYVAATRSMDTLVDVEVPRKKR